MREWEPSFDFYMAFVDGAPASFVIDLAARAPVDTHPVRLHVRVKMLTPREDGLRDKSEFDALAKLEDEVVGAAVELDDDVEELLEVELDDVVVVGGLATALTRSSTQSSTKPWRVAELPVGARQSFPSLFSSL